MSPTCPFCTQASSGRYCSQCGADLQPGDCRSCSEPIPPGGRYCNHCGTAVNPEPAVTPAPAPVAATTTSSSRLPWLVAAVAVVALTAVVAIPRLQEEPAAPAPAAITGAAPPAGDARAVDLASMTPREAADRLFNRVMQNVSSGDSAQARGFLPMAIAAYQRVPELDLDGRYHIAVLKLVGEDWTGAKAEAEQILAAEPNHLFGLFTLAQAEQGMGNDEVSTALFRRFVERFDEERARQLPEYVEHDQALEPMREEARRQI